MDKTLSVCKLIFQSRFDSAGYNKMLQIVFEYSQFTFRLTLLLTAGGTSFLAMQR